jgi:hypothetical protein
MLTLINPVSINSNDYLLCVKTMLEEVIAYYRLNGDNSVKVAFAGLELTDFAGLKDYLANYQLIKEAEPSLEHLLGFNLSIPFDFKLDCKQDINLTILIRSDYCTDTKIKQNKIFDFLRFTLLQGTFFWSGEVATDINSLNTVNVNPRKYRIGSFIETNQKDWYQASLVDNHVISQMNYKFKIFKNN